MFTTAAGEVETMKSYCSVCDAELGGCEHNAHRYLDDVVYERTASGWKVIGEEERERFYNPVKLPGGAPAEAEPVEIQRLVVELEAWMPLDGPLETELRRAYELNPRAVTLIAQHVLDETKAGKLRSPGGLLMTKLRNR